MIALAIGLVCTVALDTKGSSAVLRGDFPAFYSLAVLANSASPEMLYDLDSQTRIQNEAWPDMQGAVLPGAYPPYVAYLGKPLALMGPALGKALWTLLSVSCFFAAVFVLFYLAPQFFSSRVELTAALSLFSPVLMGVLGGQVLAFSMLLYALILALDKKRDVRSEILLGVIIGAWLFKPQYALIALLMPVVQGRIWVLGGFLVPASLYFAAGVKVLGLAWLPIWLTFTRGFAEMNFASNASQMSNLVGASDALVRLCGGEHEALQAGRVVSLVGCGLLMIWLAISAFREREAMPKHTPVPSQFLLLLGPTLALATPQANFYDLGLAIIPFLFLIPQTARGWMRHFGALVVLSLVALAYRDTGIPIFALVSCIIFVVVARRAIEVSARVHQLPEPTER
jgi:hypothetical protein